MLWGTTGAAATLAPDVSALTVGATAMGVGGLLQAASAGRLLRRHRMALAAQWRLVLVSAVAVAVFPLAFYSSMRMAGVAIGTVVTIGSAPLAAALIERVMDRSPLSSRWAVGTAVGVAGVLALAFSHGPGPGTATAPVTGIGLGLVAGVSYALFSWGAARVMQRQVPGRAVMGAMFGIGGVVLLPVAAAGSATIVSAPGNVAVVGYLAVVPMFLGYLLFGHGLRTVSASTATTVSLAEPAVAALLAVALLDERLSALGWVGLALLFVSLLVATAPSSGRAGRPDVRSMQLIAHPGEDPP